MSFLDTFRERRPFPGQDPWVVAHDGSLLLVQSAGGSRRIVVKRFTDLTRMDRNTETVIWAPTGSSGHEIRWAPLTWDAWGYPVVRLRDPSGRVPAATGGGGAPGLVRPGSTDGLDRVA